MEIRNKYRCLLLNAATFLLPLLLFTLSTGIAGAQVNITQAITAANGACPTFPASQTTFQPGATAVWFDFA